jgi:hypothetical protein
MTDLSVFRDEEDPACWRVEDNDYENDGGCTLALFAGPTRCSGRASILSGCNRGW